MIYREEKLSSGNLDDSLFDFWLNRYVYDKICDSNLKVYFAKFMPSIRLIHLKLFRSYNSTIKWKEIAGGKKAEKKKSGFQKRMASVIYSHHYCGRQLILFA